MLSQTEIEVTNKLHELYRSQITDFGVEKEFRLVEDEEERNTIHSQYPIPEWATPISDDSTSVNKDATTELNEVPELATRGHLDSNNYAITRRGIETEGGPVDSNEGYPQIEMKAPYRYRDVETLLDELLMSCLLYTSPSPRDS